MSDFFEYPFKSNYYQTKDGQQMHYVDEGAGPPIVMVHGNPSWSYLYRRLISALSPKFRCLAPDHIGMGLSSRPDDDAYPFYLYKRVEDFTGFLDHLALSAPVHLVVHDWGGPIGLSWAVENPDKVASVTLMNTALAVPLAGRKRLSLRLALFKRLGPFGSFLAQKTRAFTQGVARFGVVKPLPKLVEEGFLAPYQTSADRLAVTKFVEDIPLNSGHPSSMFLERTNQAMNNWEKPTAIIWGLRDFVFHRDFYLDWKKRLSHSVSLVLPTAGHYLLEDEPFKIINFVERFINEH